ncbi:MAG: exosortase [Planctomycetes bacterium]|nr:exosortase [Planctomycetota bacterium]
MPGKQLIKAIILVGSRDFGRCPLTSRLPTALWPVVGKPVLERLLTSLADQGIKQVIICSNGDGPLLQQSVHADNRLELNFLDEPLPVGTAGCIRDAAGNETDALLLVFPAGIMCPPKIDVLIKTHREGQSDLTVMFNPACGNDKSLGEPAGIYVCETSILKHIPKAGYFDIKEGLIPEMLRAGKTVYAATLQNHAGNFRIRREYLYAITNYLENSPKLDADLKPSKGADSQTVWIAANAKVEPGARIYGPAVIMDGACVSNDAVILGPTILGNNVTIGKDSVVVNSVLWEGARVGPNCQIQRCLLGHNAALRANTVAEEKSIPFKPKGILERSAGRALKVSKNNASRLQHALQPTLRKVNSAGHLMVEKLPSWVQSRKTKIVPWLAGSLVLIAFLWSYKAGLADLWNIWQRSDEYSSGLLVPFLAVYILWSRRHDIAQCKIRPSVWGLFAFIAAQAIRLFGLFFMYSSAERLSIVLTIAALVLLLFGWQLLRKVSTVLLYLCLMLPWPNRMQAAVTLPLQRWATSSAVFCLEMVGYEVVREGNVIHIGDVSVAVAEACNGLRMITAFFVISGLVVLLVKRAWWEKLIVLVSSLPIALLCNTVRLAITASFFTVLEGEHWEKIFHDFGGYAMMPLALAAVVAELWLLAKLTTPPDKEEAIIIKRQNRVVSGE